MKVKAVFLFVTVCCLSWSWQCFAMQQYLDKVAIEGLNADLVWSQSDGLREEIFLANYKDGIWSKSVAITDDNADNLHPAVDQTSNGTRWIAWTAIEDGSYSIVARSLQNEQLGELKIVSKDLTMSIYPSVIVDHSDNVWIIWAGNSGTNDDIYYSRLVANKWQKPHLVHQVNQVPDIRPSVLLSSTGKPVVRWQRFIDGSYREFESFWLGQTWSVPRLLQKDENAFEQEKNDVMWKMALKQSRPASMENVQSEFLKIY